MSTLLNRSLRRLTKLRRNSEMKGHIDAVAGQHVSGWAFAVGGVRVEASVDGKVIASVIPQQSRPDVADSFPTISNARTSGFILTLPESALPKERITQVRVGVRHASGRRADIGLAELSVAGQGVIEKAVGAPAKGLIGPLPQSVMDVIAALWPEAVVDLKSQQGQQRSIQLLGAILATPDLRSIPPIAEYTRYLRATWAHCQYVDRYFPTKNVNSREGSLDFHCKPNSIRELFSIIHQLYVNKSYGICGDFAEFGCFKGFSSSVLSYACDQLGIKMLIFDSFEGLPPAEGSGYTAGDYAGSLEEVTENIRRFGVMRVVECHKGFFADTFKTYRPPPLMCLWMDVDLECSAKDLVSVADRLDPKSALFSHECEPKMFIDGAIVTSPRADNPIPPVLSRFEQLGRPLTGEFICGNTGAFWPREEGIPVLQNDLLMKLVEMI